VNLSLFPIFSGVSVLMFHGLCERVPEYALFPEGRKCLIEVEKFSKIINWCSENYKILRLTDLDDHLLDGSQKPPGIILTFDDGLASVIDLAIPILQKYCISAVLFVTTDWIDSGRTPDIFLLEKTIWKCLPANLVILIDGRRLEFQIDSRQEASKAFARLWEFLFEVRFPPLKLNAENIYINGKKWERRESEDRYFWFPATWKEICGAVQTGLIEIGSHMVSHTPLTWLSDEEKLFQLKHSRDQLSNVIGLPVKACSYPHGPIDKMTMSMSEKVYQWGFTNRSGRVCSVTNRIAAPRYPVHGEAPEHIINMLRWGRTISRIKRVILPRKWHRA
jgi:peptidoglycan/xylan/chitin deacetylase (PgdA/CDA1 family)